VKITEWARLLGKFIGVQVVVQIVGLASGILLVRVLPKQEYAYFTMANAMLATMTLLADVGISSGLSSIGGKVWNDPQRFGSLINTALALRRNLAVVSIALLSPILLWMLIAHGSPAWYAFIVVLPVVLAVGVQIANGVLATVPRLQFKVRELQNLELFAAVLRLSILAVAYLIFLNAVIALVAAVMMYFAQHIVLQRLASTGIDRTVPSNEEDHRAILGIMRRQAPNDIYYCIQGQITVWLISIFGTAKSIADIGALGRLAMIFAILASVMASIVVPRYARCQAPDVLRRRYHQILAGYMLFGAVLIPVVFLFPDQALWILGDQYAHLRGEVVLIVISAVMNSTLAGIFALNASKAWIPPAWINIGVITLVQIMLLGLLDLSTVRGVILFNILSVIPAFFTFAWVNHRGIAQLEKSPA
jgi:O-antigen/teichoic acid export membrane protein